MIAVLRVGSDVHGLGRYLLAKQDASGRPRGVVRVVGGTAFGTTPAAWAEEWATRRLLRPRVTRDVRHACLRAAAGDRVLSDEEWHGIAAYFAQRMGWDLWVAVQHDDHVHIAASRIRADGSVAPDSWSFRLAEQAVREIEAHWGLSVVAASPVLDPDAGLDHRRALTKGQVALGRRGREVAAAALQAAIDQTISPGLSWEE